MCEMRFCLLAFVFIKFLINCSFVLNNSVSLLTSDVKSFLVTLWMKTMIISLSFALCQYRYVCKRFFYSVYVTGFSATHTHYKPSKEPLHHPILERPKYSTQLNHQRRRHSGSCRDYSLTFRGNNRLCECSTMVR